MPACQVFPQRWLSPEEYGQVNYLWLDLLGLFLEKCQRLILMQLFPCRAPTIATESSNKFFKKRAGELWLWPLIAECSEDYVHVRKAKGKQWAGKLRQLPLNNSHLTFYFNIIISGCSLYAWFIQVSSARFSTLHITVLLHMWKCS